MVNAYDQRNVVREFESPAATLYHPWIIGPCELSNGYDVPLLVDASIKGVHINQDLIWCVKIGVYMGFWVHRGS